MRWVQKYAPLFGGDPGKYTLLLKSATDFSITIMGESAGASSIMHHLTAKGGNITLPFQKAIIQSPAFFPQYDPVALDLQYRRFVESAGCPLEGAFECLQRRSPRVLQQANQRETARAEWGKFTFGPAVDGIYVRDLPGRELLHGNHVKNITILQGHNEYVMMWTVLTLERRDLFSWIQL
jgi:carboxylesterase type B